MSKNVVDFNDADGSDKQLEPEQTDMFVDMLANQQKLITEDRRWDYQHRTPSENNKDDDDDERPINDNIDNYKKEDLFGKDDNFDKDDHKDDSGGGHTERSDDERKSTPKMSDRELKLKKLDLIRKLGELQQYGAVISQNYNLSSDLESMEFEYKLHSDIRSKQNAVGWMSHMMIGIVKGVEILNDSYNPFEIKLKGLSTKVNNDMKNYYDVLGEIYEKYHKPGKKMAPELRLLLMITGAGLQLQINKFIPNMIPKVAEDLKDDDAAIDELERKAAERSDKYREEFRNKLKKEHETANKIVNDLELMKEKDIEYQKIQKQELGSLYSGLEFTERVPADGSRASRGSKSRSRRDEDEDNDDELSEKEKEMEIENLAMRERIQELEMEKRRKIQAKRVKMNNRRLEDERKKLRNTLSHLRRDVEEESMHSDSSSASSIYVNPNGLNPKSKKKKPKKVKKGKKKKKSKKKDKLDDLDESDFSVGSGSGKKKTSGLDAILE